MRSPSAGGETPPLSAFGENRAGIAVRSIAATEWKFTGRWPTTRAKQDGERAGGRENHRRLSTRQTRLFYTGNIRRGLSLQGWEVKSARAGKAQISESHVASSRGELFLLNSHFAPLSSASSHVEADPKRSRKLLMTRKEISNLAGKVQRAGFTLVPLNMHLLRGKMKLQIGLAKGKKKHDKRRDIQERESKREQQRIMRGEK